MTKKRTEAAIRQAKPAGANADAAPAASGTTAGREAERQFLKATRWGEWRLNQTDQLRGVAPPPLQKSPDPQAPLVDLVAPEDLAVGAMPVAEAIRSRRSHRSFNQEPLTIEEVSFLLWATQGVRELARSDDGTVVRSFRTVPSGGARHPFETYLLVNRVTGLPAGLYRYLPLDHQLCLVSAEPDLAGEIHVACHGQYVLDAAVVFLWTAIPYRTEWRYGFLSPKLVAQDSGHVCQNLYLAATAIGAGTCAIGAYDQDALDPLLGVDGTEEFAIYVAPVGKIG